MRESRTVLKELGLELEPSVEIRVWDTTADTRYMVLPERPAHTAGWTEEQLAANRVRVKLDFVPGHIRLPGYIRGKVGVVVGESPAYPFPDAHAHGVAAEDEPTYDVRFRALDLWPNSADAALVHVGVFQSYLVRAA